MTELDREARHPFEAAKWPRTLGRSGVTSVIAVGAEVTTSALLHRLSTPLVASFALVQIVGTTITFTLYKMWVFGAAGSGQLVGEGARTLVVFGATARGASSLISDLNRRPTRAGTFRSIAGGVPDPEARRPPRAYALAVSSAATSLWVRWRCPYRLVLLLATTTLLLCGFWFASRYPQLFAKSHRVGDALPSMAFGHEVLHVDPTMPWWQRIAYSAVNWLDGMKIGMSFGVAFGALLHTVLRYYPLKIGSNLYLNSVKGALVGAPAGVCANCAVPVACGLTRGHGRVEVALGFLFSSPNLNPIVITMTFAALPLEMAVVKYAIVAFTIAVLVPAVIGRLSRDVPLATLTTFDAACELPSQPCDDSFVTVARELGRELAKNVWMLAKPTLVILLGASIACAVLLELVPWTTLLANTSPLTMLLVAIIATAMPVPIALDVMFAALLLRQGAPHGYVMLFAMTLGIYSIVPTIYLWREVSKRLAVTLFVFFVLVGWICGLVF